MIWNEKEKFEFFKLGRRRKKMEREREREREAGGEPLGKPPFVGLVTPGCPVEDSLLNFFLKEMKKNERKKKVTGGEMPATLFVEFLKKFVFEKEIVGGACWRRSEISLSLFFVFVFSREKKNREMEISERRE